MIRWLRANKRDVVLTVVSRLESLTRANDSSLSARPWVQAGYQYRPVSSHDQAGHSFKASYPYYGWVGVQVDDVDILMYSNDDDGVAMVYHAFGPDSYEAATVAAWLAVARLSQAAADVGSFTGLFSLLARRASPTASVIAVEPNAAARARLSMNLVANRDYPAVTVAPYAVADRVGTLSLHVAWGLEVLDTGASLTVPNAPSWLPVRMEIVTAAPLDVLTEQYGFTHLDVMKIDVEGREAQALLGARKALSNGATLFIEVQDPDKFAACCSILADYSYNIFAIDDEALSMIPYDGSPPVDWFRTHLETRVTNFVCTTRDDHLAAIENAISRVRAKLPIDAAR